MSEQEQVKSFSPSGWRYVGIWLAVYAGTAAAVAFLGYGSRLLKPFAPITVTLSSISCIGMTSFMLWGLLFTVPMYYLAEHWLKGGCWWRVLPAIAYLQGILASLNLSLMGDEGAPSGGLFRPAKETLTGDAAVEEMERLSAIVTQRWADGAAVALTFVTLLLLHIAICGPKTTWIQIKTRWTAATTWLRAMREQSKAEEEERKKQEEEAKKNQQEKENTSEAKQ